MSGDELHLAIALEGAGWHPAAWRQPDARPADLLTAGYWVDVISEAERGLVDLVTIEDSLALEPNRQHHPSGPDRVDRVRGQLDAVLIAARVAPLTGHVGLIPTVTATHTEPFHTSKAIATLDHVSKGRAGVRIQASARAHEAAHFGRRQVDPETTMAEAADYVEVIRRLWDSWEDDAEIRDAATGRFIDRDKLHYIDFEGEWFSVRGPSITPRPPQGQPIVAALAHGEPATTFAAAQADIVFVTPTDGDAVAGQIAAVHERAESLGRTGPQVWGDVLVHLAPTAAEAADRRARLDELSGRPEPSDAAIFAGTPDALADLVAAWSDAGLDGVRLRPGSLPHDLDAIVDGVVPALQNAGRYRRSYPAGSLRDRLGLDRPANRYALNGGSPS